MDYGFWSVVPPLVAIILAITTRQVFLSLGFGIWMGWVIVAGGNILNGSVDTVKAIVEVFKNEGSTQTIIFTLLIGSLLAFIQKSGGVNGFIVLLGKKLDKQKSSRIKVQLLAALTGMLIFVESNISALTVGTVFRPISDKLMISREKLAYLADSTSSPSSILIPFNAWGGFIMGLLLVQGFDQPFISLVSAIPYNLYPILALILLILVVSTGKDFGPMKKAEARALEKGEVLRKGATPLISAEITQMKALKGKAHRAVNMLLPIGIMVICMPLMLVFTGWQEITLAETGSFLNRCVEAIGHSKGAASVLYSVLTALLISALMIRIQGIMKIKELISTALQGMSGMMSMALLMVLAFAIGNLCNKLGTGEYVAEITGSWLSPKLVPMIVFLSSCFIAFSTGTSWGTFAIMIAIAVPVAETMNINMSLAIAAALGGGVFGDHCSPISDTTMISSMASASDHIDHVRTQLPYALAAGITTALIYLLMGILI